MFSRPHSNAWNICVIFTAPDGYRLWQMCLKYGKIYFSDHLSLLQPNVINSKSGHHISSKGIYVNDNIHYKSSTTVRFSQLHAKYKSGINVFGFRCHWIVLILLIKNVDIFRMTNCGLFVLSLWITLKRCATCPMKTKLLFDIKLLRGEPRNFLANCSISYLYAHSFLVYILYLLVPIWVHVIYLPISTRIASLLSYWFKIVPVPMK